MCPAGGNRQVTVVFEPPKQCPGEEWVTGFTGGRAYALWKSLLIFYFTVKRACNRRHAKKVTILSKIVNTKILSKAFSKDILELHVASDVNDFCMCIKSGKILIADRLVHNAGYIWW